MDTLQMADVTASSSSNTSVFTDAHGHKRYTVKQKLKSSEFDPNEYAKIMGDIKRDQATRLTETKIEPNNKQIESLRELKTYTKNVQNFSKALSDNLNIESQTIAQNLWNQRYPIVRDANGTDKSSIVRVTTTHTSPLQSFTIQVDQLASSDKVLATQSIADAEVGLGLSGTLRINGVDIAITDGSNGTQNMTLLDIRNAVNDTLGAAKSTVRMNLFSGDGINPNNNVIWQLTDSTLSTPIDLTGTDLSILDGLSIPRDALDNTQPYMTPTDDLLLSFHYNGVNLTRAGSNVISDLIAGTTIEVNGAQTGILSCTIDHDRPTLHEGIERLIENYNALQKFVSEQRAIDEKTRQPKEDAYLYNSNLTRQLLGEFDAILSSSVTTIDGKNHTLKDLGITVGGQLNDKNSQSSIDTRGLSRELSLDASKLDQILYNDDIDLALGILGDQATSTHSKFTVYKVPNSLSGHTIPSGTPINMTIERINGEITATFSSTLNAGQPNEEIITSNAVYKGSGLFASLDADPDNPQTTPFDGLRVGVKVDTLDALQDGDTVTSTLTTSQGLLTRLTNIIEKYTEFNNGYFDTETAGLESANTRYQEKVDHLNTQAIKEEERTLQRFAGVREVESKWQNLLSMMENYLKLITRST